MHFATSASGPADELVMRIRTKIKVAILAWLAMEAVALILAIQALGWPATLLIGLLTSALGFYIIREAGREGLSALRQAMNSASGQVVEVPTGGVLRILSGLLLVMPGFVSDFLGLVLLIPPVRALTLRRFAPASRPARDGVVDLDPDEWRTGGARENETSCEPLSGVLPGEPKIVQSRRRDDE